MTTYPLRFLKRVISCAARAFYFARRASPRCARVVGGTASPCALRSSDLGRLISEISIVWACVSDMPRGRRARVTGVVHAFAKADEYR